MAETYTFTRTGAQIEAIHDKVDGIAAGAEVNPAIIAQALAEAGVDTTGYLWSAERVAQAIAALAGGGQWTMITSDTVISGQTESIFTDLDGTGYTDFKVVVRGLRAVGAVNTSAVVRVSKDNGATFLESAYYDWSRYRDGTGIAVSGTGSSVASISWGCVGDDVYAAHGELKLLGLTDAAIPLAIHGFSVDSRTSVNVHGLTYIGRRIEVEAYNAIRVYASFNTWAAGSIELWGK